MSGPDPSVAAVRVAVRRMLARQHPSPRRQPPRVLVACSGGADSVALAAATAFEAPRLEISAGLVTIDHGLQPGSAQQAGAVSELGRRLGLDPVLSVQVQVGSRGGVEAAARTARYAALREAARTSGAEHVLLGHTLDDQAETVLLGLGRGSGPRSVAGMRPVDPPWLRPLLQVRRATTAAACVAENLPVWADPHNCDRRFTRSRLRHEVLPLLEDVLQGGVAEALARTATLLRADLDALDAQAERVAVDLGTESLDVQSLAGQPAAVRGRVLRSWLREHGVGGPSAAQLYAIDALVTDWRGQGPVAVPGGLAAFRRHGRLHLGRPAR